MAMTAGNSSLAQSGTWNVDADGNWGDTGAGETGTISGTGATAKSTVNVTIVAGVPKCVWVCCESTVDTTDCQVPDQCN